MPFLRRPLRSLLILLAAFLPVAALPASAGAFSLGLADNNPAMFYAPSFRALHLKEARLGIPWDVATRRADRHLIDLTNAWLIGAAADHITPIVSFGADGGQAGNVIPTPAQYGRAVRAFVRRFPQVRLFTAWNEPDWIYRPPIARHPDLAAAYFNTLTRVCNCHVIAGDVYLPASDGLGAWLRAYRRYLHHRPAGWALHNYDDVRTHTTSQLSVLLGNTTGPVFLDEVAGVERRGHWPFPNQSAAAAARDERFLLSLARFRRVQHIDHYQWAGDPRHGWDSGLVSPNGARRPAYRVVLAFQRAAQRAAGRRRAAARHHRSKHR